MALSFGFGKGSIFSKNGVGAAQAAVVPASGLVAHLDAGNQSSYSGSGTVWYDLSGQGNNAACYMTPTYSSSNGGYFSFAYASGTWQQLFTMYDPASLQFGTGDFTISAWVNPSTVSYGASAIGTIISKMSTAAELHLYQGQLGGHVGDQAYTNNANANVSTNTWFLATLKREGSAFKIYNNTTQSGSGTSSANVNNAGQHWNIGWRPNSNFGYQGKIAAIYMYNRALSDAELTTLYNVKKSLFGL
jgi:hypothetical protein